MVQGSTTARTALRQRRREQGLTQEAIAHAIGVATTTYREWERGTTSPRVGFRPRLARQLGVSLAEVARLLDQHNDTPASDPLPGQPHWLWHFTSLEQGAARVCTYEPVVIPGLLQVAGYATALERDDASGLSDHEVARRVAARLARQLVLTRTPDPLELSVVIDESVLHRVAGDRAVMAEQLDHLADVAAQPNLDVRVLPLGSGVFNAAWGSFTVLTACTASTPCIVCTENRTGINYLENPHTVTAHTRLFEHLQARALSPGQSLDLIRAVGATHRR